MRRQIFAFGCTMVSAACGALGDTTVVGNGGSSFNDAGTAVPPADAGGDAGSSVDGDAGSSVDGGLGADAGAPDRPDAASSLVPRVLCGVSEGSRELVRVAFPSGERVHSFEFDRFLGGVYAVDSLHEEMYVSTEFGNGLQVFSATAADYALPLRTLSPALRSQDTYRSLLAVAIDTLNDTLILLMSGTTGHYVETYARTASGQAQALRRFDIPAISSPYSLAVDASGERIFIADSLRVQVFSLTASGAAEAVESLADCGGVAVSPGRNEVHLACRVADDSWEIRTWPLGVSLAEPPARALVAPFNLGAILTDELHGEFYGEAANLPVFGIAADGPTDPLLTATARGRSSGLPLVFKGLLPVRDELILQPSGGGTIEVYSRPLAPAASPLRVLEGQLGSSPQLLGFDASAGELYLGHSGGVEVYAADASGAPSVPVRRLRGVTGSGGNVALAMASKELFAAAPSLVEGSAAPGVFDGSGAGQLSPLRSLPSDLDFVLPDPPHGELLAVTGSSGSIYDRRLVAFAIDAGAQAAPLRERALISPRPFLDVPGAGGGRIWWIRDVALDTVRDRVLLSVVDCFEWATKSGGGVSDCHLDIWSVPRTWDASTAVSTFEVPVDLDVDLDDDISPLYSMPFEIQFDERNDLILAHVVQDNEFGVPRPRFFRPDSSEATGLMASFSDVGVRGLIFCD